MDNKKDDIYYIKKAIENIDTIILYTKDIDYISFLEDQLLLDATMFRLIQMVENVSHISKEFKEKHSHIKWGQIVGFRNGIVHDYGKTDYTIVFEIISSDIYTLKENLQKQLI